VMVNFCAAVWDTTWRVNRRSDLARMNGIVENRGTNIDRAHSVCVHASGWSGLTGRRELGIRG